MDARCVSLCLLLDTAANSNIHFNIVSQGSGKTLVGPSCHVGDFPREEGSQE